MSAYPHLDVFDPPEIYLSTHGQIPQARENGYGPLGFYKQTQTTCIHIIPHTSTLANNNQTFQVLSNFY